MLLAAQSPVRSRQPVANFDDQTCDDDDYPKAKDGQTKAEDHCSKY
jgi:hypothetical protein